MRLVLDASVAIAAQRNTEPAFVAARARVTRALCDDELVLPGLFPVEVAASLARAGRSDASIRTYVERFLAQPHEIIALGRSKARQAVETALRTKLRGADVAYVWLAAHEKLPLCTLDKDMAAAARALHVKVITP